MNFRHPSDKSIAYLEPHGIHTPHIHNLTELHNMNELAHDHFDMQFLRYSQVLDTDYDNFVLLYTCQEAADFALKEQPDKLIGYVEAYQHHKAKHMHNVEAEHKHTRTSYEFKDTIHVRPIHKERIQILWRAGKPTIPHHVAVEGESDK